MNYHSKVSFTKSGFRLAGYICLLFSLSLATGLLIGSELLGIMEEL